MKKTNAEKQWNLLENHQEWENLYNPKSKQGKSLRGKIHQARKEALVNLFEEEGFNKKESKILEVGYGAGLLSAEIYQRGYNITGLDLSKKFQEMATQRCQAIKSSGTYKFLTGNALNMPFPDDTFDCVIGSAFLHYFNNPMRCLKEIRRVLKPGGIFIIGQRNAFSVSQFDTPLRLLRVLYYLVSQTKWETSYIAFPTKKRLLSYKIMKEFFRKTDFDIKKFKGAGFHHSSKQLKSWVKKRKNPAVYANNLIFVLKKPTQKKQEKGFRDF